MSNENFMGIGQFVWWQGVVEDVDDPLMLGRCRVRVLGFHTDNKSDLPTEHLPWATPIQPVTSAAMGGIGSSPTGLLPGTWVVGFFRDSMTCQEPIIMGSIGGIPSEKPPSSVGFSDPSGTYPVEDKLGEPDTNRLARNEKVDETVVKLKKLNLQTSIAQALSETEWSEPESPYAAQYPKNHVTETESGHIQEFDDTPGSERIHTYHKAGTFSEIHPDGTKVSKIVGDNYTIVLEDNKILIKGTKTENIEGDSNLRINQNLNIQVDGDVNFLMNGNCTMETKGDFFHKVGGVYAVVSEGNMVFLAPRIDLNPNDSDPSTVADPF